MIYAPHVLLGDIRQGKILRNLSQRELVNPEGVGFDLRLASVSVVSSGSGRLMTATRRTPSSQTVTTDHGACIQLLPGRTYLATTIEEFDLPPNLAALFFPRSTLFRSGIAFQSSVLPPGYVGPMTFSLTNNHSEPFEIEREARFSHVVFFGVTGDLGHYRGQWQGGRVSQPDDEGQI